MDESRAVHRVVLAGGNRWHDVLLHPLAVSTVVEISAPRLARCLSLAIRRGLDHKPGHSGPLWGWWRSPSRLFGALPRSPTLWDLCLSTKTCPSLDPGPYALPGRNKSANDDPSLR